ncbi:MAG: hypothetical protein KJ043_01060 [Anaerolineae bacterium]|nr:hypothetical protein [Anaerolineae bacterium]
MYFNPELLYRPPHVVLYYSNTRRLQEALACFERAYQLEDSDAMGAIQQVKRMMGNATPPPPRNEAQVAFEAFQRVTSPDAEQYPILKV